MPSLSRKRRNKALSQIQSAYVAVRTLPNMIDLAQGRVSISDLHESVFTTYLGEKLLFGQTVKDQENPDGDIAIRVIGFHLDEKLFEEVLIRDNPEKPIHQRILKAFEDFIRWLQLESRLNALEIALSVNYADLIRLMMQELVNGYGPSDGIVDWAHLERESQAFLSAGES